MRAIRASEIGSFEYCRRSWWYSTQDVPSSLEGRQAEGWAYHESHGRTVVSIGCLRVLGYGLVIGGLALAAALLTAQWLG